MAWSDEQIEQVRTLAAAGQSAGMIANEVGATRNAVVGVGHRNSIKFHGINGHRAKVKQCKSPSVETAPEPECAGLTILELQFNNCRYPLGDPLQPDFRFCGKRKWETLPYCGFHSRLCYETTEQRRARFRS